MDVKEPPKEHLNTKQILCPPFPLHPITRVTTPFRHPQVSRPWRECRSAHGSEYAQGLSKSGVKASH